MNEIPILPKGPDEIYCPSCAKPIKKEAVICPKCGVQVKELKIKKPEVEFQANRPHSAEIRGCPVCGSQNIVPFKKGFGAGKALVGGFFLGPIGVAAGAIGSNKIILYCLNCGYKFRR